MNKQRVASLIRGLTSRLEGCPNPMCYVCSKNRAELIELANELQIPPATIIPIWLQEPRREGAPL